MSARRPVPVTVDRRWLFSPGIDLGAFLGSALASGALAVGAWWLGQPAQTPLWAWVLLVLCIDVAHVWSTLFRVYLDGDELKRRPALYGLAPVVAFVLGVLAYQVSAGFFWRVLAYVAAWHFVRQQLGWMLLYGRRAHSSPWQVHFDQVAIGAATLGPFVWWHANLPRPFSWFMEGDFVPGLPQVVGTVALWVHAAVLVAWVLAELRRGRGAHVGKLALLAATWVAWFGGIVLAKSDFWFTATNVVLHGVPYQVLLWRYARGRDAEAGYGRLGVLLRAGVPGFIALLLALAFAEELLWDKLVWHEHAALFGASGLELPAGALALVVPLLSLPQTTHYLLDGFIWRTRADPALAPRLGWAERSTAASP